MTDRLEWKLVGSNGTVIVVTDVALHRAFADVPDLDQEGWITRVPNGPVMLSAIVVGTEPKDGPVRLV